jgi:hypothetical protein
MIRLILSGSEAVSRLDHSWQRTDFERWFDVHSFLPDDERVLVVGRHQTGRRSIALVALDREGGLVILEVADGPTGRRAVGAALEHLARYEGAAVEALLEDEEGAAEAFHEAFRSTFGVEPPTLTSRRRVLLVAPSHGAWTAVCARYLARHLQSHITVRLLKARRSAGGFVLEDYDPPPLQRAAAFPATFAVSAEGRLFYVLEPGRMPVVWSVGRIRDRDGAIVFKAKPPRRTLRVARWPMMPVEQPDQVDMSGTGTIWMQRDRTDRVARVIGSLRSPAKGSTGTSYVVFASFRQDRFRAFRIRPAEEFFRRWAPADRPLPGWGAITLEAERQASARKSVGQPARSLLT